MSKSSRHSNWVYVHPRTLPFWGVHVVAIAGVALTGISASGIALAFGLYYLRMFFVTAGYHRYFAHRSYKTSRWFQFVLAFGAQATLQKGALWWASQHRHHHRTSDTPDDVHSPVQDGFWWSHLGWILSTDYNDTRSSDIRDFYHFPELVWLNRYHLVPPLLLAAALALLGGFHALLWGFFVSTTLLWHGTFTINSLSHVFGKRRYATSDDSRNNWLLALITMGEGWHNNHHHYMNSANQGFRWYEIDLSYYLLRALAAVGIVWNLKRPPQHIIEGRRRREPQGAPAPAETRARAA